MITQYDVPCLLKEELPAITSEHYPARITMDVYKSVQYFSDYTRWAVLQHNLGMAKKCFSLAGKLYQQGDNIVKNVIENTFVYSFSSFIPNDRVEKLILVSLIPSSLYAIYLKQVTGSGC